MSTLSKDLIRQIIADRDLSNPKDIGEYLKDMFKDVNSGNVGARASARAWLSKGR